MNKSYTLLDLSLKLNKSLYEISVMKNTGKIKLVGSIAGVAYYRIVKEAE